MTRIFYFLIYFSLIFILFLSCTNSPNPEIKKGIETQQSVIPNAVLSHKWFPDRVIFGTYYGECVGNCSTLFSYRTNGNIVTLYADYTGSFYKEHGNLKFDTKITDTGKIAIASDIAKHIPKQFLTGNKNSEKYGCPDCKDQGGIYLELEFDTLKKEFFIDTDTSKLIGEIKNFSLFIQTSINKIKK